MGKFKIQPYNIMTPKVKKEICLAVLTDLHGCRYGEGQQALLGAVASRHPDGILLVGDITDQRGNDVAAWELAEGAANIAPTYFVTGNHEYGRHLSGQKKKQKGAPPDALALGRSKNVKDGMEKRGVKVLAGDKATLPNSGNQVVILGIDDEAAGEKKWNSEYKKVCEAVTPDRYTILLSHRPESDGFYKNFTGDLVVSGHAHGGEWRLPFAKGGLYAPGQGLFPKRAGGLYPRGQGKQLVSCGLCYKYPRLPRIGNPTEAVILRLCPTGR